MTAFNSKQPAQTRCGYKADIVRDNLKGPRSIVAIVTFDDGEESALSFYSNGRYYAYGGDSRLDLINVPFAIET